MGREVRLFKSEERHSRGNVSAFLHELADKIADGRVVLQQGTQELRLDLPASLVLEIQVVDVQNGKRLQHSLEVEFKWFEGDSEGGPVQLG